MATPLLSIGIIFKNEIRSLERCLQALEPLRKAIPCQLVMADTGSEDGSRAVAERYADVLFDFPWVNDFAAARNAVMERCSGAWYLSVDCDEYLDPEVSQLKAFLSDPVSRQAGSAQVVIRNYRTREMAEGDCTDFLAQRLVRMSLGAQYVGAIHEHWELDPKLVCYLLDRTVLHHDGYVSDRPEEWQKKLERNLALLRGELARDPDNPRILLQCIEASDNRKEEQAGYLNRGMELVLGGSWKPVDFQRFATHLYRHGACAALLGDWPQAEEWLAWGEAHMGDCLAFRVDVAAAAAQRALRNKEYQAALDWTERYEAGCADYDAGRYESQELSGSALSFLDSHDRSWLRLVRCASLIALERQEEAADGLEELEPARLCRDPKLFSWYLDLLSQLGQAAQRAQAMCARLLEELWAREDGEQAQQLRRTAVAQANRLLGEPGDRWRLFIQVPGDLGRAVRAVDSAVPREMTRLLAQVERWEDVPDQVVFCAVERCAPLPPTFYRQGEEALRALAARLGAEPGLGDSLLRWTACDDFEASLTRYQFLFQLTASAILGEGGKKKIPAPELMELFLQLCRGYLPALYNPELLSDEEEWPALPGLHRCALYLVRAMDARAAGEELECVRALRNALEAAPGMKGLVDALLAQRPQSDDQRQLEELARQVREILSQYPPDHPAVQALKQSPAYRSVAHLLE